MILPGFNDYREELMRIQVSMLDVANNLAGPAMTAFRNECDDDRGADEHSDDGPSPLHSVIHSMHEIIENVGMFVTIEDCKDSQPSSDLLINDVRDAIVCMIANIWAKRHKDDAVLVARFRQEIMEVVVSCGEEEANDFVDDELFLEIEAIACLESIVRGEM